MKKIILTFTLALLTTLSTLHAGDTALNFSLTTIDNKTTCTKKLQPFYCLPLLKRAK